MKVLILYALAAVAGAVVMWVWIVQRVNAVIEPTLTEMKRTMRQPDFLTVADDLFFAVCPGPLGRWIDRRMATHSFPTDRPARLKADQ